jgi:hypothetical protein
LNLESFLAQANPLRQRIAIHDSLIHTSQIVKDHPYRPCPWHFNHSPLSINFLKTHVSQKRFWTIIVSQKRQMQVGRLPLRQSAFPGLTDRPAKNR